MADATRYTDSQTPPSEADDECPLFMMGLPTASTLENNTSLQALITLVDDPDSGSKACRGSKALAKYQEGRRARHNGAAPYHKRRGKRQYATVAEAQVYLSLL
jgi:hypothetical protein